MSGLIEYYARRRRAQAEKRAGQVPLDAWDPTSPGPEPDPASAAAPDPAGQSSAWTNGHVRNVRPVRRPNAARAVEDDDHLGSRNGTEAGRGGNGVAPSDGREFTSFYDRVSARDYPPTDEHPVSPAPTKREPGHDDPRPEPRGGYDWFTADPEPEPFAAPEPEPQPEPEPEPPASGHVMGQSRPDAEVVPEAQATPSEDVAEPRPVIDESPTVELQALTFEEAAEEAPVVEPAPQPDEEPAESAHPAPEPEAVEELEPAPEPVAHQSIQWPPPKPQPIVESVEVDAEAAGAAEPAGAEAGAAAEPAGGEAQGAEAPAAAEAEVAPSERGVAEPAAAEAEATPAEPAPAPPEPAAQVQWRRARPTGAEAPPEPAEPESPAEPQPAAAPESTLHAEPTAPPTAPEPLTAAEPTPSAEPAAPAEPTARADTAARAFRRAVGRRSAPPPQPDEQPAPAPPPSFAPIPLPAQDEPPPDEPAVRRAKRTAPRWVTETTSRAKAERKAKVKAGPRVKAEPKAKPRSRPRPRPEPEARTRPRPEPTTPATDAPLGFRERGRLRQRASYLRHLREVQVRDLGGFVLELYRFDQWRGDLVGLKLAEVAETDRELRALESVLGEERPLREVREAGIGGVCGKCGTLHGSVDRFCPGCGESLKAGAPQRRQARGRRDR